MSWEKLDSSTRMGGRRAKWKGVTGGRKRKAKEGELKFSLSSLTLDVIKSPKNQTTGSALITFWCTSIAFTFFVSVFALFAPSFATSEKKKNWGVLYGFSHTDMKSRS